MSQGSLLFTALNGFVLNSYCELFFFLQKTLLFQVKISKNKEGLMYRTIQSSIIV